MALLERLYMFIVDMAHKLDELGENYDLNSWRDQLLILHALQIMAQALLDITMHASSLMGSSPESYREAADILRSRGVIDDEDYRFIKSIIGFRNIIVHQYLNVDIDIVEDVMRRREYRRIVTLVRKIRDRLGGLWDP